MPENIFEFAVANKLRFPYKGLATVEDLYDLPVTALDDVYKALKREEKKIDEESLLETKSKEDVILSVKIEIVKFIVAKKLEEKKAREAAADKKRQKNRIQEILAQKQDEALAGKSVEELEAMLAGM